MLIAHAASAPELIVDHNSWDDRDIPTSSFSDHRQGTLLIDFATTIDAPLMIAEGECGIIELIIDGGRLNGVLRCGDEQRYLDAEDAVGLDDGALHSVGITVDDTGTHVFVDGYEAFSATMNAWFADLELDRLMVDPDKIMHPQRFRVWNGPLSAAAVVAASVAPVAFVEFAAAQLSDRDAHRCSALRQGSIRARFRTRGLGQGGVIIAAGGDRGRLELGITDGDLYYRWFDTDNRAVVSAQAAGRYDDGQWHDVVVVSGRGAIEIYADGYQLTHVPGTAFFADVGEVSKVTVGVDLEGSRLFGEAQTAYIYDGVLTDYQIKRLAGVPPIPTRALFDTGYYNSKSYRIPSLLTLASGVILAGADQRVSIPNDSPNDTNFVMRRSLDGGRTWLPLQVLISYPGEGRLGASATDSALVQDEATGRVFALVDHFPGGIGQPNCGMGTGHDETGRQILVSADGQRYIRDRDDGSDVSVVYDATGQQTPMRIAANGDVFIDEQQRHRRGNIYLARGVDPDESLLSIPTSYIHLIYSDDDGQTWSDPIDITAQVKKDWMRFLGISPGNGIQLQTGSHAGRLLVPVYYSHESAVHFSTAALYSDDGGHTWQIGQSPNDGRELNGTTVYSDSLTDPTGSLFESALVEDSTGTVHVYLRNQHPSGKVGHATSIDGGVTWSDVNYEEQLDEVFSQPNAVAFRFDDGNHALVFANASAMLPFRGRGVIRVSMDDGKTWAHNRVFNPRHYVYQCMTQLPNGNLGLLWEREWQGLFFSEISQEWLRQSLS